MIFHKTVFAVILTAVSTNAFGVVTLSCRNGRNVGAILRPSSLLPHPIPFLYATAPAEDESSSETVTEIMDDANGTVSTGGTDTDDVVMEKEEEEEKEPKVQVEDPALTALKKEIADLESALKAKTRQLSVTQEQAERYTKTGYARRVAEVENMRRLRKSMENSNAGTATASVVQSFLPIVDELKALKEQYAEDDFGKQYSGLTGAMTTALKALGVEEFTATVGGPVDPQRMNISKEEHSKETEKGMIIRVEKVGLELNGNIMRLAEVVVSLGAAEAGTGFGSKEVAKEEE